MGRPGMLANVTANVRRQREKLPVCIVETGDAVGVCKSHGYEPDMLLTGPAHPAHSRNAALIELGKQDAHCIFMDEDDYYGPHYAEEHVTLRERERVVGKVVFWVQWCDQLPLVLYGASRANKHRSWLRGGTIGGFAKEIQSFPAMRIGEDAQMCQDFLRRGGEVWCSSVSHCVYRRYEDGNHGHLYNPSRGAFDAQNGPISRQGSLQDVNRGGIVMPPPRKERKINARATVG